MFPEPASAQPASPQPLLPQTVFPQTVLRQTVLPRQVLPEPAFAEPVPAARSRPAPLLIDCDSCSARPTACGGCVVALLLEPIAPSAGELTLDGADQDALRVLADAGLAPRLRHVPGRRAG